MEEQEQRHKPTCGPLFTQALQTAIEQAEGDPVRLFSAGHMCGQAEKIYLGACMAAMFRPSPEHYAYVHKVASKLACIYGLCVSTFDHEDLHDEIWLHKLTQGPALLFEWMLAAEPNSPMWHYWRGMLCGVPSDQIDANFHLRTGYKQPCDIATINPAPEQQKEKM